MARVGGIYRVAHGHNQKGTEGDSPLQPSLQPKRYRCDVCHISLHSREFHGQHVRAFAADTFVLAECRVDFARSGAARWTGDAAIAENPQRVGRRYLRTPSRRVPMKQTRLGAGPERVINSLDSVLIRLPFIKKRVAML